MMKTLLILAAFLMLSACATPSHPPCVDRGDGLCWWVNPLQIHVEKYTWEVDTTANANTRCGYETWNNNAACMMGRIKESKTCHIVSALTETQAQRTPTNTPLMRFKSTPLRCHELKDHCGLTVPGCEESDGTQWLHSSDPVYDILGGR